MIPIPAAAPDVEHFVKEITTVSIISYAAKDIAIFPYITSQGQRVVVCFLLPRPSVHLHELALVMYLFSILFYDGVSESLVVLASYATSYCPQRTLLRSDEQHALLYDLCHLENKR